MNSSKYKICIVVTMSSSVDNWIKPFIHEYLDNGFDLTIVCNATSEYTKSFKKQYDNVTFISYAFPRGVNVIGSIKSIRFLSKLFKNNKYDLVQYSTPNASFYSSVASKRRKIRNRLYCQWGMVYLTAKGIKRIILKTIEKITCRNSTIIEPDSTGNMNFCRLNKFYSDKKSRVIWNGSAKGLDLEKFDYSKKDVYKHEILNRYPILRNKFVIGFVGRLGRDKGSNELIESFKRIKQTISNAVLLFIGPLEKEDTIDNDLLEYFYKNDDIVKTGRVTNVEKYYSVMDVFVLPSYREGFGMSVVEAESFGIPVVVTKYPGPECGMINGQTGFSIPMFSVDDITEKIVFLHNNKDIRDSMAKESIKFARDNFDFEIFKKKYIADRLQIVEDKVKWIL